MRLHFVLMARYDFKEQLRQITYNAASKRETVLDADKTM